MIKQTVAHMEIGVKKHKDSSIAGLIEELIGSSPKTNTNSVMLPRLYRRYRVTHFNTSPAWLLTEAGLMVRDEILMTYIILNT